MSALGIRGYQIIAGESIRAAEKRFAPDEDCSGEIDAFIGKARSSIKMVAGELDPKFFEADHLISSVKKALRKGCTFKVVFYKNSDKNKAEKMFLDENKKLVALKKEYPDNLKLFWSPTRPSQHYAVIDNKYLFIEGEHDAHQPKETFFIYNAPEKAMEWGNLFDKFIHEN